MRRNTVQRIRIREFLRKSRAHPTAEMVYEGVRKDLPAITLATVYRNLHLLAEEGEILKLKVGNTWRFDGNEGSHVHGVCADTGSIVDIEDEHITRYALREIRKKGFEPDRVTIIFHGHCKTTTR